MELTSDDRMRARVLGGDEAEDYERTGVRRRPVDGRKLWSQIMGDAKRQEYPASAVSELCAERDYGFDSYL